METFEKQLIEHMLSGERVFLHVVESNGLVFQTATLRKTLTDEDKQLMSVMFESLEPFTHELKWDLIEKGWRKEGLDVIEIWGGFSWNLLTQSFLKMGSFARDRSVNGLPWHLKRRDKFWKKQIQV